MCTTPNNFSAKFADKNFQKKSYLETNNLFYSTSWNNFNLM